MKLFFPCKYTNILILVFSFIFQNMQVKGTKEEESNSINLPSITVPLKRGIKSVNSMPDYQNDYYKYRYNINTLRQLDHLNNLRGESSVIFGNSSSLNYYYVDIYIGEPPQKQSVIIDTGSHMLAVPCSPLCTHCGKHINTYYSMDKSNESSIIDCETEKCKKFTRSSCNQDRMCTYSQSYAEGSSLSGVLIEDKVLFGDTFHKFSPLRVPFGCTTSENKLFYDQEADGILGLANSEGGFIRALYDNQIIPHYVFSLCLAQNGGYFSVGGLNTTLHNEEVKYLSYGDPTNKNKFLVNLQSIRIDSTFISVNKNALIDSGTTLTYVPEDMYNKIENTIKNFCSQENRCMGDIYTKNNLGLCFKLRKNINTVQFLESMPTLTFTFDENVTYDWKPQNYIYNNTNVDKKDNILNYCIGIYHLKKGEIILGSTWMHNHDIVFDLQDNRVGFAESNCADDNYFLKTKQIIIKSDCYYKDAIIFIIAISALLMGFVMLRIIRRMKRKNSIMWTGLSSDPSEPNEANKSSSVDVEKLEEINNELRIKP